MKLNVKRISLIGDVFTEGFKKQALHETTTELALTVGLVQGLKYNGSLKRGLTSGAVTIGVVSAITGLKSVVTNWDTIKKNTTVKIEG